MRGLSETVEKFESDRSRMVRQLAEIQETSSKAEMELRSQVRQAEVKAAGLEAQVESLVSRSRGWSDHCTNITVSLSRLSVLICCPHPGRFKTA